MIKKIIENTVFAFLLLVLAISISPVLPFKNVPRTYTVVSGSMEPTIKTGSIVLTTPVDPTTIMAGDIVAFTSPSNSKDTILHRIVDIKSTSPLRFQTKGDNNNTADAWDLMDVGILGKHVFAIPYIGHIAAFIRTPIGFGVLIVIPALLFIISQILNIKKYIKQEIDRQVKSKTVPLFFILSFLISSSMLFTGSIFANFYSTTSISQVTFSTKDFVAPPTPQLIAPTNNSYRNTVGLVMDWSDVGDYQNQHNPVYYIYQSSRNLSFSPLAYQSGRLTSSQIPAPGTPAGVYYWRVKACDSVDNCSAWTSPWKVTVDNQSPQVVINAPITSPTSGLVPIYITSIDTNPHHFWLVVENSSGVNVAGPGTTTQSSTLINHLAFNWDTTLLPDGLYTIKLEARDAAGNKTPNLSPVPSDPEVVGDSVDWITVYVGNDTQSPRSTITEGQADTQETHTFDISYSSSDLDIDYVKLCYSYNFGTDICGDTNNSPSGLFTFDSPFGDGLYSFYTIAYDLAGNIEDLKFYELDVQVDTKVPTTNVDLKSVTTSHALGQNLLTNGGFEQGMSGWVVDSLGGDHHIVSSGEDSLGDTFPSFSGDNMFILGDKDSLVDTTFDRIFQEIYLPQNLSSSLSFSYRAVSFDIVDNDYFSVDIASSSGEILENVLTTGSDELGGNSFIDDSGWVSLAHSLLRYAGQTIKVFFTQYNSNPDDTLKSWTYVDDIKVNSLDLRLGETLALDFDTHDTGSGILLPQGPSDLTVGENVVEYQNDDIATNVESTESVAVVVLPPVVINKIDSSGFIELYNNTTEDIDISSYKVNNIAVGSTVLPSHQSVQISVGYTETYILNDGDSDVDTSPQISPGDIWRRTPFGIGTWAKDGDSLDFNLVSRSSVNKVTLSVFNLSDSVDYEIIYNDQLNQQGIYGTISIVDGGSDRDFYLGTCSSGVCLPHAVSIGSTISVTIDGVTKYFNY